MCAPVRNHKADAPAAGGHRTAVDRHRPAVVHMPCPMSGPNPSSPAAASAPGNAHHERPSRRTAGRQRHRQDPEQHPGDSTRHGVHAAVIAHAAGGEGKPHGRNRACTHHSGTFRLMQRLAGSSLSLNTGPCISRRRIPPPHDRHRRTGRPPALHPPPLRHAAAHGRPPAAHGPAQGRHVPPEPMQAPFPSPGSGSVAARPRDGRALHRYPDPGPAAPQGECP